MEAPTASLREDVLLAQQGNSAAFTRLVHAHSKVVRSITYAIVGDRQAGDDLAQEVFLEVWETVGSLRFPDSFLPWLRQVAGTARTSF